MLCSLVITAQRSTASQLCYTTNPNSTLLNPDFVSVPKDAINLYKRTFPASVNMSKSLNQKVLFMLTEHVRLDRLSLSFGTET